MSVLPLQVSPLDVSPPLRLLSASLLLSLYCFSVQSTDSCLLLLSFFALMLQWYRKHTLLSSASSPSLLPSLLRSDWLLHRDDISLFIVVSLSPSLSLCIPPAPPFLFTSMPPPLPYFYLSILSVSHLLRLLSLWCCFDCKTINEKCSELFGLNYLKQVINSPLNICVI